jgi:hypothetical protein
MIVSNFNKEYLQYLFPQRTRLTTEYALTEDSSQDDVDRALCKMVRKDYHMIEQYLPIKCDSILDIGCGLALSDIAIYNHYKSHYSHDIDVYLLDKNEFDTTKISGFNKEYKGYNSMSAANDTLVSNGVPSDRIHMYETDVDLFEQTLSDDGVLVLDIRHDTGQVETVKSKFNLHRQIYNHAESKHTGGNIGDRYIFTR